MCGLWAQRLQCDFFLSKDRQELATSPELGVDEARWAQLSEHRVPGPVQGRETGKAASCPGSGCSRGGSLQDSPVESSLSVN